MTWSISRSWTTPATPMLQEFSRRPYASAAFKEAEHVCQDSVTKCSRLQLPCQVGARPFAWQRSESATPWVSPNSLSDSLTCQRCVSKAAGQLRLGAAEHSGYRLCFRTLAGLAKFCQTDPLSIVTKGFGITQQLSPEWCIEESVLQSTLPRPRNSLPLQFTVA